ncbi:MAG: acyl-CoA thioesterase [Thermodesulfobacteriota bacterium]
MSSPAFPHPENTWNHRVSYGETDAMGVVYYANYLHWFEQARSFFIRELGMSYKDIETRGVTLPVREAHCRYRSPASYEDEIAVRTGINEWRRASLTFVYAIYNLSREQVLMATGSTQHACTNSAGRPVPVPEWLKTLVLGP